MTGVQTCALPIFVMLGELATDDDLTRKASALRKQFERLKERLRSLAAERLGD